MSAYHFAFIGHCTEGTSDKIWGVAVCGEYDPSKRKLWGYDYFNEPGVQAYAFWGKRGKTIKFKKHVTGYDLENLIGAKMRNKGYVKVGEKKIEELWPDFEEQFEKGFVWQTLMN